MLLNVFLRLSTHETIRALLTDFGIGKKLDSSPLRFRFPAEIRRVQPDAIVESDTSRIFLEIKIDAGIRVEQVEKYQALHADMNKRESQKKPYLLFLTKYPFKDTWRPKSEATRISDIQRFLEEKTRDRCEDWVKKHFQDDLSYLNNVKSGLIYAAATWTDICARVANIRSALTNDPSREIELRVVDDFLADLRMRGLANSEPPTRSKPQVPAARSGFSDSSP